MGAARMLPTIRMIGALKLFTKRSLARIACAAHTADADGVRFLVYHSVDHGAARTADQMVTPADLFESQMKALQESGVTVCDALWVIEQLRKGALLPRQAVVLTFDDGLADFREVAYPILRRFGYPATVFLIAGALERKGTIWDPWPKGYMTMEDVRELERDPLIDFGCHSATHAPLTQMTEDALTDEVAGAKGRLEDLLGRTVELFAYPYGVREMWEDRVPLAVEQAGFKGAFTSIFGRESARADIYRLRRSRVSWTDDYANFGRLLAGCHDWYAWVQELQVKLSFLRRVGGKAQ